MSQRSHWRRQLKVPLALFPRIPVATELESDSFSAMISPARSKSACPCRWSMVSSPCLCSTRFRGAMLCCPVSLQNGFVCTKSAYVDRVDGSPIVPRDVVTKSTLLRKAHRAPFPFARLWMSYLRSMMNSSSSSERSIVCLASDPWLAVFFSSPHISILLCVSSHLLKQPGWPSVRGLFSTRGAASSGMID